MTQQLQEYPPNARHILNEIMKLMFAPEAATGESISSHKVGTLATMFSNAAKSDVATVNCFLRKLLEQFETLENQMELRDIEDANREFKLALKAQEERLRTMQPVQAERLRSEARQNLRKWHVTDQAVV